MKSNMTVIDCEFPSLNQEKLLPNLSRFGRWHQRILIEKNIWKKFIKHPIQRFAENKLNDKLIEIEQQMNIRYVALIKQFMKERNVNEELKEKDYMRWVQKMNNIEFSVIELIKVDSHL